MYSLWFRLGVRLWVNAMSETMVLAFSSSLVGKRIMITIMLGVTAAW
jgi:hypothetical protein